MIKGAKISECGKYRYQLWRIWDESLPKVLFIMHNPSTADADVDDPTIRRCIAYAKEWGYGGLYVGNLSPYRATDPKDLKKLSEKALMMREQNIFNLIKMKDICNLHVLAYGNPVFESMVANFIGPSWHYLKRTKLKHPCHPLYLKKDLKPIKFI